MRDSLKNLYCVPPDLWGAYSYPQNLRNVQKLEKVNTVQAISWGENHCVFVDRKNRVFSFG